MGSCQCCPVNLRGLGQKAKSGAAFRVTWGVSDLNRKWPFALAFRVSPPRSRHVPRQDPVRAGHGLPAVEDFHRIVNRYGGDHRTRSLSCAEQFRVMAFAQLTYRESLRDIEVCLAAQAGKLYHMGIGAAVARSTLADANESRDWRIYFELAQRLIIKARALYVDEDFGVELANTVYALDATTIDLCLSMFPWAPFRSTKAAVK